jgi:2-methylcitrate dehydratase PrpD
MELASNRSETDPGATRRLADFAAGLSYGDLDAAARHAAKRHILDTLGACLAGAGQSVTATAEALLAQGSAAGSVPVPGRRRRAEAATAAYLAGAAGHGLELDDGYRPGSVHPGCVVVPAALAAGYGQGASPKAFLTAVTAGYEVAARIAAAAQPDLRRRGFHATGACGGFGAAAAVGVLRGLGGQAMEHAFGLAASSAGGLFAFVGGGGEVKRLHAGQAARAGLLAALMAERGVAGPPGVLECPDGFFQAFAGGAAPPEDLGPGSGGFAITQCYIKPYACCRHFHAALDALFEILEAEDLDPASVERIEVGAYAFAAAHGSAGWDNMATAQLSFPFVMATALHRRAVRIEDFSEAARRDPKVTADCAKIAVSVDADCEARYPRFRPAKVTLRTKDGRGFARAVDEPLGAPHNPLDDAALGEKYLGLAGPVLGAERARETLALLWRLDQQDSVVPLCNALAG